MGGRSRGSRSKPLLEDPAWLVTNKMQQISISKTLFTTRHPARRPAKKKTLTTSRCVETQKTQEILPHFLFTFEKRSESWWRSRMPAAVRRPRRSLHSLPGSSSCRTRFKRSVHLFGSDSMGPPHRNTTANNQRRTADRFAQFVVTTNLYVFVA